MNSLAVRTSSGLHSIATRSHWTNMALRVLMHSLSIIAPLPKSRQCCSFTITGRATQNALYK